MIELEQPLILILLAPLFYLWWRLGRGPREAWAARILMLLLGVLILSSPTCHWTKESRHVVILIDHSLSCGKEASAKGEEVARLLQERMAPEDRLSIVTFGQDAGVQDGAGFAARLTGTPFEDASDLSAGLALSSSLLAGTRGGQIFLISDGLYTGPDPMESIPLLHKARVAVDYSPIFREETSDVAIGDVHLPERVQEGHPFEISFFLYAPVSTEETLVIETAWKSMKRKVRLHAGENRFTFRDVAGTAGLGRYTLSVSGAQDPRLENNRALAVTHFVGSPRILVLNQGAGPDGMDSQSSNLTRALDASGMQVVLQGRGTSLTSADLKPFEAVVLENLPLSSLNDRADAALRNFVRETGGGLLITGGRRSYAEGGYYQSRLEEVLPVSMMRREEFIRSKIAICLVLDRSGSMSVPVGKNLKKMDLANRAAVEALRVLLPQDEAAVIAVDSAPHVVLPLTAVKDNQEFIQKKVLSIHSMGGGIFVYTGLLAAVRELLKSTAGTRHIVLFSDAADSEEPGDYKNLIKRWVQGGGTLSVIGLGTPQDQDAALLMDIAGRGGGSVFFTADPHALPRVFCEDAIRIARKTFLEKQTRAVVTPEIIRIGKLDLGSFPGFLGYNLCTAKEAASQLITTADENLAPVLAVWQSGLGRAAALTCEVDGPFTGELRDWPQYKPFLSSLVKWLQRERDDLSLFGTILRSGRTATVVLEMEEEAARNCTGATVLIIPPSEKDPLKVPMRWVSPSRMEAAFKLKSDGVYHGVVLTREGRRVSLPAVILPYSPEFEPARTAAGVKALEKLAAATKGKRVMHVQELLEAPAGEIREAVSMVPLFSILLLLLLLCEIVTRKHLWGFLLPDVAKRGGGRVKARLLDAAREVRKRAVRRPKRPEPSEEKPVSQREEEMAPSSPEEQESVFQRAKRRSRAGD